MGFFSGSLFFQFAVSDRREINEPRADAGENYGNRGASNFAGGRLAGLARNERNEREDAGNKKHQPEERHEDRSAFGWSGHGGPPSRTVPYLQF